MFVPLNSRNLYTLSLPKLFPPPSKKNVCIALASESGSLYHTENCFECPRSGLLPTLGNDFF